ncbi:hypothetical protein BASA50_010961 [Batrachochytrium salamandrivorans]|uniref:RecA family profile 1 domain-containing protein n=1 Tax=Batrachochytrium salamandrivorans TaxID=1357716 RepID=A0ABQ8EX51_9FUNG|nr:hypothetical protein BASA50_010961 [Batrachochytrium salamandrivorans]
MSMSLADAIKICNVEAWLDQSLMQRLQRIGIRTDGPNLPLTTIPASCCPLPAINTPPTYMQVFDVLSADGAKICNLVGCSPESISALQSALSRLMVQNFVVASEVSQTQLSNFKLYSTGIQKIDEMLDGGLRPCEIIEFSGLPSSGKTQMCHLITAVTVASTLDSRVIYIDSGGSFYASRILTMLISSQYIQQFSPLSDPSNLLARIEHVQCFSAFSAIRYLEALLQESQRAISVCNTSVHVEASSKMSLAQSDMDGGGQSTPTPTSRPSMPVSPSQISVNSGTFNIPSLIIIDSVGQLFSPLIGQGGYATLGTFSDLIINIAKVLAIPIVTVNSSVSARFSDVNSDITEYGSASTGLGSSRNSNHAHTTSAPISTPGSRQTQTKPALGAMWDAVPFYRLYFTISSNDGRAELYRVYDAPSSEDGKSDPDSRHGKFNVHGVDSQLRVVENIVELLDGPDKSKLGQRCQLLVSANDVFGR